MNWKREKELGERERVSERDCEGIEHVKECLE